MSEKATTKMWPAPKTKSLRLGFVPLSDSAPLVMAQELGLFAKYGLHVELRREVGWASIRDKIIYGELDAAHALAPMPFAATLGLGSIPCECLTGLVLNLNGNAITLSNQLWKQGVRDARSLKMEIDRSRGSRTYTFGAVFPFSSHNFLLRQWLASGGINPDTDVRIVVVPPPSMFANLKSGNLDGYCVGEPWNTMAIQSGLGWAVTTSARLSPGHPEKVLMVRRDFAETHQAEHLRLLAAVMEACSYCDVPANREHIINTLAQPQYVNAPVECLRHSLSGSFDFGHGHVESLPDFTIFHGNDANEPSSDKAAWVVNQLLRSGLIKDRSNIQNALNWKVFRADIFDQARQLVSEFKKNETNPTHETNLIHA
jgi:ABC-type nitrate/sulfonate/bicarbonate transport system substrate-binding protein